MPAGAVRDRPQGDHLEMINISLGPAVGLGHVDELAAMIEGEGKEPVMPAAARGGPVDLLQAPVLAKSELLAACLDHMTKLGLRRIGGRTAMTRHRQRPADVGVERAISR